MDHVHLRGCLEALTVILVLSAANFAGLHVFSSGFLTSRVELPHRSSRTDIKQPMNPPHTMNISMDDGPGAAASSAQGQFDRVILLIVDALRVDFMFPGAGPGSEGRGEGMRRGLHEGQMPRTSAMLRAAVSKDGGGDQTLN